MNERTNEEQFLAEHNASLREDLKQARNEIATLAQQVLDGKAEQEKLSYKNDFLVSETVRLTASREQYERIAIRTAALADGALTSLMAALTQMHNEIRDAAFTKVPGTPKPPEPTQGTVAVDVESIAKTFAAGFDDGERSALPLPRFGNSTAQAA